MSNSGSSPTHKTIVLFGETGVGKSSVINLIAGRDIAKTSSSAEACTLAAEAHSFDVDEMHLRIYDTVGLEEPEMGVTGFFGVIQKAHELVTSLEASGGIDLLLFCVRGRITATTQRNYRLFSEFLCAKKVPLALVITNLENEDKMEGWWANNAEAFDKYDIVSVGHACITAVPAYVTYHARKREQSRVALLQMLRSSLSSFSSPYVQDPHTWFMALIKKLLCFLKSMRSKFQSVESQKQELAKKLVDRCSLTSHDAKTLADMLFR